MSTAAQFRDKSADQLGDQLANLKKEQFNLRFQRASGQLEKTNRIREVRRDIARIQTILGEWARNPDAAPHPGAKKEKKTRAKTEAKTEKAPAKKRAKKE